MDYRLISADDHIDLGYLPRDLWTNRLPQKFRDRAPKVVERDGGDFWVCEDQVWGDWRGGAWWSKQRNQSTVYAQIRGGVAEDYVLRPTTPELRLIDMDRDNVEASVMFGPILPMQVPDPDLRHACVAAYNEWLVEFCSAAPGRFIGVAMVPTDDPQAAKAELQRIAALGLRQVNFLVGTVTPPIYSDEAWDVFWSACEDAGLVVSYHVGGGGPGASAPPPLQRPLQAAFRGGAGFVSYLQPFTGLFNFGVLDRHPKLRFVMAESGTGWIPYVVQEMDYRYRRTLEIRGREDGPLTRWPSQIFREQVWATYQEDRVGLDLINFYGEGHMMWASDYPHPDSTWPNSVATVEGETAQLSPDLKRKILRDNAQEFYGL